MKIPSIKQAPKPDDANATGATQISPENSPTLGTTPKTHAPKAARAPLFGGFGKKNAKTAAGNGLGGADMADVPMTGTGTGALKAKSTQDAQMKKIAIALGIVVVLAAAGWFLMNFLSAKSASEVDEGAVTVVAPEAPTPAPQEQAAPTDAAVVAQSAPAPTGEMATVSNDSVGQTAIVTEANNAPMTEPEPAPAVAPPLSDDDIKELAKPVMVERDTTPPPKTE